MFSVHSQQRDVIVDTGHTGDLLTLYSQPWRLWRAFYVLDVCNLPGAQLTPLVRFRILTP